MEKEKRTKYTSGKIYFYIIAFFIIAIFISWYIISWKEVKNDEQFISSYLLSTGTINYEISDIKEINQVMGESPNEYFVYVGYTKDENVYKLEKKLKRIIDDYNLKDYFYYLDITKNIDEEDDIVTKLNEIFTTENIKNVPCILYFKDGILVEVISNSKGTFEINEFSKLLKNNEFEKIK